MIRRIVFIILVALFPGRPGYAQDSFITIGIHPGAAAQSTNTGKQIATLFPWKGRLYAGYGDYGANTGPIHIYAFDPDSQKFTFVWEANTEAIYNFRAFSGRVFAPAIDRKSYGKPGDYTMLDTNGIWADYNFSGSSSTHVYDVASLNDTILYMVGSQEERAAVWESKNNGLSWKTIHYDTAVSGNPEDFARYYFAGSFQDKLYVQAMDYYGSLHPYSEVWDGSEWERDTSLFGTSTFAHGRRPDTFAGKMIYLSPQFGQPGSSSPLRVFDGTASSILDNMWVIDFMVDTHYLYALVDSGFGVIHVRRTSDLINWFTVAKAPYGCRSFAILNDKIYLGMADSKIMEYSRTISDITTKAEDEINLQAAILLFPNPCYDVLKAFFSGDGEKIATVIDYSGRVLSRESLWGNPVEINISSLPSSIYLLELKSSDMTVVKKFYKK